MKHKIIAGLTAFLCFMLLGMPASLAVETGVDNLNQQPGDLYVAYLGGSITEGAGGSTTFTYKDGQTGHARWSSQVTKRYFEKQFPNKNVIEVNAGVGGTTSDLGLFRLENDVIRKCGKQGPDVVFVEFAVNDMMTSLTNPRKVQQTMEGIVRQLTALPKVPVIIFVYSYGVRDGMGSEVYGQSAALQQEIADYYGISSLNLWKYVTEGKDLEGQEIVWRPDETGKWTLPNSWTGDGTHPNNLGYTQYADYIIHQFETNYDAYFKPVTPREIPLSGYDFGHPKVLSHRTKNATYTGDWKVFSAGEGVLSHRFLDGFTVTNQAGATVSLSFTGRSFGIYASRSSMGAKASYVIDQGSANPITGTISNYYPSGAMSVATLLRSDLTPGNHTITITTLPPDQETKERKEFLIGYFFVDEPMPTPMIASAKTDRVGTVSPGEPIRASYSYVNQEKEEGKSAIQWYQSQEAGGPYLPIEGATNPTFLPDESYLGKWIQYSVTPINILGQAGKSETSTSVAVANKTHSLSYETGFTATEQGRKGVIQVKLEWAKGFVFIDSFGRTEQISAKEDGSAQLSGIRDQFDAGRYVKAYWEKEGSIIWSDAVYVLVDWTKEIQ